MKITLAKGRKNREMKRRLRQEVQLWKNWGEGGVCRMELPLKESMSQKRKLQLHQPRGSEAKKVILSR